MAITTMQQVLDAMPGQHVSFYKGMTMTTVGWGSSWNCTGYPIIAANPSSGAAGDIPTNATTGAFPITDAASGSLYLARWIACGSLNSTAAMLVLYDRLWQNSGINATITTSQTINSTALTRPDANGAQAEVWWQVYATMGAGTPQVTLTYTNQSGTGSRTAISGVLPTAMAATRTGPFQLAEGDTGVRSIQSWQADATFTSGTIGLVLRRRIAELNIDVGKVPVSDALRCGLAKIPVDACLEVLGGPGASNPDTISAEFFFIEG